MEQRDYILREIERIGFLLARLRDRILGRTATTAELRLELQKAAGSLGADLDLARTVAPETLVLMVGAADVTRRWFFAEALYLEGLDALAGERIDEAADLLARARFLFATLADGVAREAIPDVPARIAEIDAALAELPAG
jgi:hypothetical protein